MLTALVPGVREVRAPLASGALWFCAIWLVAAHVRPSTFDNGIDGAPIRSLADFVGRPGVVGAATAAAFVLGALNNSMIHRLVHGRIEALHLANPDPNTTSVRSLSEPVVSSNEHGGAAKGVRPRVSSALEAAGVAATAAAASRLSYTLKPQRSDTKSLGKLSMSARD